MASTLLDVRLNIPAQVLLKLLSMILCAVLFFSCNSDPTTAQLEKAEAIIDENPEEALKIIEDIDTTSLSPYDSSLYWMVYTSALDRLHMPLPADSLLERAADYFMKSEDKHRAMKCMYFVGLGSYRRDNLSRSINATNNALLLAKELNDPFWIGLAARNLSDVYNDSYNGTEAVEYAGEALDNFNKTGKSLYIHYALADLGRSQMNSGNYKEAVETLNQALDSADNSSNEMLKIFVYGLLGRAYLGQNELEKAAESFETVYSSPYATMSDSAMMGVIYADLGHSSRAKEIMDILSRGRIADDNIYLWSLKYSYDKSVSDYPAALISLGKIDSLSNSLFKERINKNIVGSFMDMYEQNKRIDRQTIDNLKTIHRLRLSLFAAFVILLLIVGYIIIHNQRRKTNAALMDAEILHNDLMRTKESVRHLLTSRYSDVNEIYELDYAKKDITKPLDELSSSLRDLFHVIQKDDKKLSELEKFVNVHYDNVFKKLRSSFPKLKKDDYKLLLFTALGFSPASISVILKENDIKKVYSRKRRIKDKVKLLPASKDKEAFFEIFDF